MYVGGGYYEAVLSNDIIYIYIYIYMYQELNSPAMKQNDREAEDILSV